MRKEDMLKMLRQFNDENGRSPKKREIKQWGAICYHFGSWNKALEAAGLEPLRKSVYTETEMIATLKNYYAKYGKSPTANDCNKTKELKDTRTYFKTFHCKTWADVLRKAKLPIYYELSDYINISDDRLLLLIDAKIKEIGSSTRRAYSEKHHPLPSMHVVVRRFGSWNKILEKLGYQPRNWKVERHEVEKEVLRIKDELGRIPSSTEFCKHSKYCLETLKKFESYNKFLRSMGLTPAYRTAIRVKETNEELLKLYIDFSNEVNPGVGATSKQLNNSDKIYRAEVFALRFGSLNDLRKQAGFPVILSAKKNYSQKEIMRKLKQRKKELGRIPTKQELKETPGIPSLGTILRYFKSTSFSEVWKQIE